MIIRCDAVSVMLCYDAKIHYYRKHFIKLLVYKIILYQLLYNT